MGKARQARGNGGDAYSPRLSNVLSLLVLDLIVYYEFLTIHSIIDSEL